VRTRTDLGLRTADEALPLQNEVAKLSRPSSQSLEAYTKWFREPHPVLGGLSKTFLDNNSDLVRLGEESGQTDYLSRFLRRHWPVEKDLSDDGRVQIGRFSEASISTAAAVINIAIAALLLIGPIIGLFFVSDNGAKLGMIAAFTAAFAVSVGIMTNAKRPEIFAATAAYVHRVLPFFLIGTTNCNVNRWQPICIQVRRRNGRLCQRRLHKDAVMRRERASQPIPPE
jgi:hypothetical protein